MLFPLTEEQKARKQSAREFAEKFILPHQKEDEQKGVFRREFVNEMGKRGFFGTVIPPEYGGNNWGILSTVLIVEEIARISASYCMLPTNQCVGPGLTILKHGTEEQKKKYIPPLVSGEAIGCFASTEPDAGTDVGSMKMTAQAKGDDFILNGTKTWITAGSLADMGLFWVFTDKSKGLRGGVSAFIVDMKGTTGLTSSKIHEMGLLSSDASEVAFLDVKVPKDNMVGKMGDGYAILMETLSNTRWCAAARALGVGGACLEDSINTINARKQAGHKFDNLQMLQNQIAEMFIEHEGAKVLLYQGATNKDKGVGDATELPNAKYFCAESAVKAAEIAMEICGTYGVSMDLSVHRYMRDSRCFPITEGTSNILKVIVAGQLIK